MSPQLMHGKTVLYKNVPNSSRVLKSSENISKSKFNRTLRNKLKKYKLRKDGLEDPEILDVSKTLATSLKIKSPNNQNLNPVKVCGENRPYNYLSKMVRLSKDVSVIESTETTFQKSNIDSEEESISSPKYDQDKKETNAFKLLMDSRNKSIGSNSPGKEKCEEANEMDEVVRKKELKAKRILSLNKMAEAKGSLKKIEIEENREENIKKKLEDRARRFKEMIEIMENKNVKRDKIKPSYNGLVESSSHPISSEVTEKKNDGKEVSVFKIFDIFKDIKENTNKNAKKISKEDEDFLNKLSPSIRKKENMLCYFQKVNKESDIIFSIDDDDTESQSKGDSIIKVKLKPKNKIKIRKIKQGTRKDENLTQSHEQNNKDIKLCKHDLIAKSKKRKRNDNNKTSSENIMNNIKDIVQEDRPKRNTKKPVKYSDDFLFTSSDEELHIFTPKKKRKDKVSCESLLDPVVNNSKEKHSIALQHLKTNDIDLKNNKQTCRSIKKKPSNVNREEKCSIVHKKASKLAPIFKMKPQLDPAAIEAKQKFLQSGVPSQLKKNSTYQTNILASDEFPIVVHIQNTSYRTTSKINNLCNMFHENYDEDINLKEEIDQFKKLLQVPVQQNQTNPIFEKNVDQVLQYIKKSYPKFPVYRTYHLLRGKSKGEFKDCIYPDLDNSVEILNNLVEVNNIHPDKLNWVDKYKPASVKQVIGNFESIKELRRWLVSWTESNANSKKNNCESDSSDFYQSDTDSREAVKNINNLLIITGKVGTGKTQSVYAVAAELAIKVIEVNASSKRTGKMILQDLQEATRSHKVDRGKSFTDLLQKPQEESTNNDLLKVTKKRGRKKKVISKSLSKETENAVLRKDSKEPIISQDKVRAGMSLILIDDADIVFDQDDGFCYAISQLIQSSKRPVILISSSLTCPHLQKFSCFAKIIKMRPFLPRMLGTWLDIMCLADLNICSPGMGAKVLDKFKGDIRKTINYLQFYMISQKYIGHINDIGLCQVDENLKISSDEENSCLSWAESEGWGEKNIGSSNTRDNYNFFGYKDSQLMTWPVTQNIFCLWWNLPNLLNYSLESCHTQIETTSKNYKKQEAKQLNMISDVLDDLSLTDYLGITDEPHITSKPWQSFEEDSVIDNENFASYDKHIDFINEIKWDLTAKSIAEAQRVIQYRTETEIKSPSMSVERDRDRMVSRHRTLTNCLNPSAALDRRALALDYWSSCRSICRAEKTKTDRNNKRNNRFCHYLKSLNIVCKNEYFDSLGESLYIKK